MATPVMTPGDPTQYKDYQKQLHEILYSKGQYTQGKQTYDQSGGAKGKGLMDWAANNAQGYYSQLPAELSGFVKGLGMTDMTNFYNSVLQGGSAAAPAATTPSPLDTYQNTVNPFDQQVADMLEKLKNYQPPVNPFDQAMKDLLAQLSTSINTPIADPTSTPQFAAAQARNERGKASSINDAAEVLGGSGLARSSIVTDRAQEIGQQFQDYMETQIIPQIAQQLTMEKQQKIEGLGSLLNATGDQQKQVDVRNSEEYKRLGTLYDAITGQQGAFEEKIQHHFENAIAQKGSDREDQKFEFQKKIDEANLQLEQINSALNRTTTLGSVSAADAKILGVPAGTPSFQAANAVATRKHELLMQKKDNEAAMARVHAQTASDWKIAEARITADKEVASKNREKSDNFEKQRLLLDIWDRTDVAPAGLEDLGIKAGTPKSAAKESPSEMLDRMKLEEAQGLKQDADNRKKNVPLIQAQFMTDKVTADAIYDMYDNPNREAALADFEANKADMRKEKVDINKVQQAIYEKWGTPASGKKKKASNVTPAGARGVSDNNPFGMLTIGN